MNHNRVYNLTKTKADSLIENPFSTEYSDYVYLTDGYNEQGAGFYLKQKDGTYIFVGGSQSNNFIQFAQYDNNNLLIPNDDSIVEVPLVTSIVREGTTINNRVLNKYKIPYDGMYSLCCAAQQTDEQENVAFLLFTVNKNGTEFLTEGIGLGTPMFIAGSVDIMQIFKKDDLLDFFIANNKDNNSTVFNVQTAVTLLKKISA